MKKPSTQKRIKAKNPILEESTFTIPPEKREAIQATLPKKYPYKAIAIIRIQKHLWDFTK